MVQRLITYLQNLFQPRPDPHQPDTATRALPHQMGLQDGWPLDDGGNILLTPQVAQSMAAAGAGWVRINFRLGRRYPDWHQISPFDKASALQRYTQIVANARAANLKILGLLSNESWPGRQEDWQAHAAEREPGASGGNSYLEAFTSGTAQVIHELGNQVDAWEVWNEPNMWTQPGPNGSYLGGSYIYPSNFAWLLGDLRNRLEAAGDGKVALITGGLFAFDGTAADDYLRSTLRYGNWPNPAAVPFQGIGYHLYIDQGGPVASAKIKRYLDTNRALLQSHNCANLPFWITELGWTTASVSPELQASNLQTAYAICQARSDVRATFWFQRSDIGAAGLAFGLLHSDGTPKPAWDAYRKVATTPGT